MSRQLLRAMKSIQRKICTLKTIPKEVSNVRIRNMSFRHISVLKKSSSNLLKQSEMEWPSLIGRIKI